MRKVTVIYIFTALVAFSAAGQNQIPLSAYLHLMGSVGKSPATLDLVKINDSLYADLQDGSRGELPGRPDHLTLSGKIGTNGSFRLMESLTENGTILKGKIESGVKITGTREDGHGGESPVEFSEKYPEGSVQFNLYNDKEIKKLAKKPHAPEAKISLAVLIPAESGNTLISDTLRDVIQQCFFGKSNLDSMPESLIQGMKEVFFGNYTSSNESLYEEMPEGRSYDWEMMKYMHILHNSDYLLTFYIVSYGFTGGAHGLETYDYYSVDLRTGKALKLQDIMIPGSDSALTVLLTKKLRQSAGLGNDQKLSEAGYFVEEIKPTGNFYLTATGIGFWYNHYDIAPYSFGSTDLFLSFEELKGALK